LELLSGLQLEAVRAIVSKFDLSVTVVHSSLDDAPFV